MTNFVTWISSDTAVAVVSNVAGSKGDATAIATGTTTISAHLNNVSGSTLLTVISLNIGDPGFGGVIGCLDGGLNNLVAATSDNSSGIEWWSNINTQTNAQSNTNGAANTATIVSVLGAGTNYVAGLCDDYQIDSNGDSPCLAGTCYNDWFAPAKNQLSCLEKNKDILGGFFSGKYWSSTEDDSDDPQKLAHFIDFSGSSGTDDKIKEYPLRCVRAINGTR